MTPKSLAELRKLIDLFATIQTALVEQAEAETPAKKKRARLTIERGLIAAEKLVKRIAEMPPRS